MKFRQGTLLKVFEQESQMASIMVLKMNLMTVVKDATLGDYLTIGPKYELNEREMSEKC